MSVTRDWRSELLPQLTGLPLIPCGAGEKFKAPMDPTTGYPARDWQHRSYTPEEIAAMGPKVLCVGTRLGPQAGGIVCFDIDGISAVNKAIELRADPDPGGTWKVGRANNAHRYKLFFKVPEGGMTPCLARFAAGATLIAGSLVTAAPSFAIAAAGGTPHTSRSTRPSNVSE